MTSSTEYRLTIVNNSANIGTACLYQTAPSEGPANAQSLAWFVNSPNPTAPVTFGWSIDYGFVWGNSGVLQPGKVFGTSQLWRADLTSANHVDFLRRDGRYMFDHQGAGTPGSLTIREDSSVGRGEAAVGISMSGVGVFAVQAAPDMNVVFTPKPVYWVTFGSYEQGEVLDLAEITNAARIDFPPGVYEMTATLNADGSWTVAPA